MATKTMKTTKTRTVTVYFLCRLSGAVRKETVKMTDYGLSNYGGRAMVTIRGVIRERRDNTPSEIHTEYCLILSGDNHPDPTPMYLPRDASPIPNMTYGPFDARWKADLGELMANYLPTAEDVEVIADYRFFA